MNLSVEKTLCPFCQGSRWTEVVQKGLKFPKLRCLGCGEVFTLDQIYKYISPLDGRSVGKALRINAKGQDKDTDRDT